MNAQPLKIWCLVTAISLIFVLHGCGKKPVAEPQTVPTVISKIEPRDSDGKTEIIVEGTLPLHQYTSFQLTEPLRLVVDILDADLGAFKDKILFKNVVLADILPTQKENNIVRLEIGLLQPVDTKVYQADGKLMIEIAKPIEAAKPTAQPPVPAPVPEQPKQEPAETAQVETGPPATVISSIKTQVEDDGMKVIISGNGSMKQNAFMVDSKRLVVDIPEVRSKVRPSVIPVKKAGLDRIRVGQHPAPNKKVRVVFDLAKPLAYVVSAEGKTLIVTLGGEAAKNSTDSTERSASVASTPTSTVEKEIIASLETTTVSAPITKEPETATGAPAAEIPVNAQQPVQENKDNKETLSLQETTPLPVKKDTREQTALRKAELGGTETELLAGSSKYTGRKISLDLQDADLINVMRLFAEVANLNIILAPDVKGKVTVRMVNIPWDQAMDIILRMNGLGHILEDNVLRIGTVAALTKEAEEELKSKEAKKKAEDLITRIIPINYSTASTIEPTIKKSLSARGETVVDARTNTLIVKDIPRNVDEIVSLIKVLDKPIAQIMIEARIVEASLNFSREIGIQWGGGAKFDAAHGNPTGLTFPNSIGVTGGPGMGATTSGLGNWLVNMPAAVGAGSGGAMGISLASLNKAFNLDLVLSALEATGEGKIISQPKVSALDNKEAKIEQGLSIPYSTTSASGTQIQFIDAKLSLTVTPHATPDNKIFLKITATKNAPDTSILGATGQPSIRKNEATTEILLSNGETAVIGGILTIERSINDSKVPFLADIPGLGWFFKKRNTTDKRGELLIFITPRIVKQEVI